MSQNVISQRSRSHVKTNGTIIFMAAHGRVVTSSHQITKVKQRRARLVIGWVTGARHTAGHGHV